MGLNAAVYRKLQELPFTEEELCFVSVDPRTGQIDFESPAVYARWHNEVRAASKRIGNISSVHILKGEIEALLGDTDEGGVLLGKVLQSGVHSGDILDADDVRKLKSELCSLKISGDRRLSAELQHFLDDMDELVVASEKHENPIVFI